MELHLRIIGWLLVALALFHAGFSRHFKWKEEFSSVSLINRQMMYVHTFFIAFAVLLIGILCLSSYQELARSDFGKRICFGIGIFWGTRLITQFFWYSPKLWKGKRFETAAHIAFSCLWLYFTIVFLYISYQQ